MAKNLRISLTNSYTISEKKIDFSRLQELDSDDLDSWWRTVPGARRFMKVAIDAVDKHCAVATHLPEIDTAGFIQILREKIQRRHVSLLVETFEYGGKADAEDFVDALTEKFAPDFLRDFNEDSPMVDLARQNSLNGYVIIVLLKNKFDWLTTAVTDFNKNTANMGSSLIFVTNEQNPPPSLTRLSDYLTPYDIQFFALNLLENTRLTTQGKLYTSTLAAKLSGQSAILAKNLAKGELYTHGLDFVKTVLSHFDEKIFNQAVWECQTQFLLPILEQLRGRLIEKNFDKLKNIMHVTDEFGKTLDDPWDMELRHLHYYGGKKMLFQYGDWEKLELAYNARNDLSHLKIIDLNQMEKIFLFAD